MSETGSILAGASWLAAPVVAAGVLHMIVVRRNLFPRLARPIDGGRSWHGRRLLGDNKTWRGVVAMTLASGFIAAGQGFLAGSWSHRVGLCRLGGDVLQLQAPQFAQSAAMGLVYGSCGALFGLAYVAGELPNSWIKRRLGIAPGRIRPGMLGGVVFVVDQADSVVAVLLAAGLVLDIDGAAIVVCALFFTLLHLAANVLLRSIRIRSNL
jgi:hypothetical protein